MRAVRMMVRAHQTVRKSTLALAGIGVAALSLTACANAPDVPQPCPQILIPSDSAELTRFKPGPGRDIIDVLHSEQITGFAHRCFYDTDDTGAGELTVELHPVIVSSIGPASADRIADFKYFVAITDQNKDILDQSVLSLTIPFPQNQSKVQWQKPDPIVLRIPVEAGQNGDDFRVYVGLQLSREELDYQRQRR